MVLYYNPCTNMFPSGATHRIHQSVTTSTPGFNFTPASSALTAEQNCYPLYNNSSNNNSNNSSPTVATLSSGPQLGLPSSPTSQYPPEIGAGLPAMGSDVLQSGPHTAWYSIPSSISSQTGPCAVRGPMVSSSSFEEWPTPSSVSPLSASSPCISGSPVSALQSCAYPAMMSMPTTYGQPPLQVSAYHSHGVHREHYSDHLHHHPHPHPYHSHPHPNSGLIPAINGETTPVHPSPDSGLTASSDGTESPNGHQNANNAGLNTTPNGTIIKTENNSNGANRPQPARSPYEWMKKPSYQNQINPGKTRTKDKYRVVYSDHQRLELEKEFHYSRYITIRRKSELASMLSLSERQVKIWFQNRRAKERKQAKKRDEIMRKDKDHHVVHNHTQQLHGNYGIIS